MHKKCKTNILKEQSRNVKNYQITFEEKGNGGAIANQLTGSLHSFITYYMLLNINNILLHLQWVLLSLLISVHVFAVIFL